MGGDPDSEFYKLSEAYNFSDNPADTTSLQYNLSTPLSGSEYGFNIGHEGFWWTSTYNPRWGNILFLAITNDSILNYGTGANDDFTGGESYTIRCIVDNRLKQSSFFYQIITPFKFNISLVLLANTETLLHHASHCKRIPLVPRPVRRHPVSGRHT